MTTEPQGTVSIKHENEFYTASWTIEKGILTVWNDKTQKTTSLGRYTPEMLARMVLRQMIKNGEV